MESTLWQILFKRRMCGKLRQQERAPPRPKCRTENRNQSQCWTMRIPARRGPLRLVTREQVKCDKDEPKKCENLMNSKSKRRSTNQRCDQDRERKFGENEMEHERTHTVQQYDVDCVPRKQTQANRDLTLLLLCLTFRGESSIADHRGHFCSSHFLFERVLSFSGFVLFQVFTTQFCCFPPFLNVGVMERMCQCLWCPLSNVGSPNGSLPNFEGTGCRSCAMEEQLNAMFAHIAKLPGRFPRKWLRLMRKTRILNQFCSPYCHRNKCNVRLQWIRLGKILEDVGTL